VVYFVLFPALLFSAICAIRCSWAARCRWPAAGLAVVGVGVRCPTRWAAAGGGPALHASGAQTAFRFNSYVALALAERLGGGPGVAAMAVVMSVCVPLCNVAAVWPLARHGGHHIGRELLRNPLIIATVSGLLGNLLGLQLPELALTTLQRLGAGALPLGLMAVGAGLQLGALREGPGLAAGLMTIRHALLPAVALGLVLALHLPPTQQAVVLAFAAMPTASSAYVLAVRMGGHGGFVAGLITVSTLLAMVALPVWLSLLRQLA
jgi:malonate transporter and related proteins